jgi:hypothetical protein
LQPGEMQGISSLQALGAQLFAHQMVKGVL